MVEIIVAIVTVVVTILIVVAPKTKNKVDDRVLEVLQKYGVPLAEYLQASGATPGKSPETTAPRQKARDHHTGPVV